VRRSARWVAFAGLAAGLAPATGWAEPPPLRLRDATEQAGLASFVHTTGASGRKYLVETMGSGVVFFDYDGDRDPDLFLPAGGWLPGSVAARPVRSRLYRNDGGRFVDVTAASGLVDEGWSMGGVAADYDGDGDADLYVTHLGPNRLYRNEGDGTFRDVTAVSGTGNPGWSASAAWADLDGDGRLDLYVANYLDWSLENDPPCWDRSGPEPRRSYCLPDAFRGVPDALYLNRGEGRFEEVGASAGIALAGGKGLGVLVLDADADGRPDVYVANDTSPNYLFENRGGARFAERALVKGLAYDVDGTALAGMGVDAADADADGDLDLFVTNFEGEPNTLYRQDGDGYWTDVSRGAGIALPSLERLGFGAVFADLDQDGLPEIVVANGLLDDVQGDPAQGDQVFRNLGGMRFTVEPLPGRPRVSRGLAAADVDSDGDLDLLFSSSGGPLRLLVNEAPAGCSLQLLLVGRPGLEDAIGARLEVVRDGRTTAFEVRAGSSYLSQSQRAIHVGLGAADGVDDVRIRWPGAARERSTGPLPAGFLHVLDEEEGLLESLPRGPRGLSSPDAGSPPASRRP